MKTLLLKKDEVRRLIGMAEVIGAVEEAYKAFNSDQVEQPDCRNIAFSICASAF